MQKLDDLVSNKGVFVRIRFILCHCIKKEKKKNTRTENRREGKK